MFASTLLTETAAIWWFTVVQSGKVPITWNDFKLALRNEFLPDDHVRRARDRLGRSTQSASVAKYIGEYRTNILTVPVIS